MKSEQKIKDINPFLHVVSDSEEDSCSTYSQIDVKSTFQSFNESELTTSREINSPPLLSDRHIKPPISWSSQSEYLTATSFDNIEHPSLINDSTSANFTAKTVNDNLVTMLDEFEVPSKETVNENIKIIIEKRWDLFIEELKKMSVSEASIERVNSVKNRVKHIKEIVFFVDVFEDSPGHGDLNLCIEFLKNFIKIASENFKLIRFVSDDPLVFYEKIAPLTAGMSPIEEYPCIVKKLLDYGHYTLTSDVKRYAEESFENLINEHCMNGQIFGIAYTYVPTFLCKSILENPNQLYINVRAVGVKEEALNLTVKPVTILNYAFFLINDHRRLVKNTNNHLPTYPYEMCNDTNQLCLRKNIHSSFLGILSRPGFFYYQYDILSTVEFFMQIFTMAKRNEIGLTLFYRSRGVYYTKFAMYGQAVEKCFPGKPIIIISVSNKNDRWCYADIHEELKNQQDISFFDHRNFESLLEKGINNIKKVTVVNFPVLPKSVMDRVCFYSNMPIYATGASTANLAECFGKSYLHIDLDRDYVSRVDRSTLDSWHFINELFTYFPIIDFELTMAHCSTCSQDELLKAYNDKKYATNQSERLSKINREIIWEIRACPLFNEFADSHRRCSMYKAATECKDYKLININYPTYFKTMLEENKHIQFCQYICDEVKKLMIYYIQESTTEGGVFYELAKKLQQQALHPDNNMMFNQLDDYL